MLLERNVVFPPKTGCSVRAGVRTPNFSPHLCQNCCFHTTMSAPLSILLINGPNLNLLGTREPEVYGSATLSDVVTSCTATAENAGASLVAFQSNHEGGIVDRIHQAKLDGVDAIVINPGALRRTRGETRSIYECRRLHTHVCRNPGCISRGRNPVHRSACLERTCTGGVQTPFVFIGQGRRRYCWTGCQRLR